MNKGSIIKGGLCLLFMGLATVDVAQAACIRAGARLAKIMNARRMIGTTLVAAGVASVAGTVHESQKAAELHRQPQGVRSIIIRHLPGFNEQGFANNFRSRVNAPGDSQAYDSRAFHKGKMKYGCADWIFDKLVNVAVLFNRSGSYRFGVNARSGMAEVQFDGTGVKQQLRLSPTVLRKSPLFDGKPCLHFCLVNDAEPLDKIVFTHDVGGIVAEDGNTVEASAEVIQESHDGSIENFSYKVKLFTRKGCEQNYQKELIAGTARGLWVEPQEGYVTRCLKTIIDLSVPENADVDVL